MIQTTSKIDCSYVAWYAAWKLERSDRHNETRRLLDAALATGQTVIEDAGRWQLTWPEKISLAPGMGIPYPWLVDHLMSRHLGFGWDLIINDERRRA